MSEKAGISLQLQAIVLETIACGGELQQTLDQLCGLVDDVICDGICSTMLLDEMSGELHVVSAPRAPAELVDALNGLAPSDMVASCSTTDLQEQPVFVRDSSQDPRWAPLQSVARKYSIAAHWSVPILSSKTVTLGFFAISHLTKCELTPFEERILLTARHIAGIAIEHHQMAQAHRASVESFRDFYDHAPDMFISVDADNTTISECNLALATKLEYAKEDLIGRPIYDIYDPHCHANVEKVLQKFKQTGQVCDNELQLISRSGSVIVISISVSAVRDSQGEIVGNRSVLRDITERKRAEKDIRHRAEFQSLLADLSSRLIRARPKEIDKQLDSCLEKVGNSYDLDSVSLWWLAADRSGMRASHRWERIVGRNPPNRRSRTEYAWFAQQLLSGKTIAIDDVEMMPPQAAEEQLKFRRWGAKSFLMIPLLIDGKLQATCVFAMVRKTRAWSSDTISELRLIAESLATAFARCQATLEIEQLKNQLQEENIYLREEVRAAHGFDEIVGENLLLTRSLQAVEKVAPTDVPVLVLGQTGTGKELVARALHNLSNRRNNPMLSVNCLALPAALIESELFGHEKGAFTGAESLRKGRFERANGGTLFLDEIGDLPLDLQGKLLRVLQTGKFERLGGTKTIHSDVRLIAATNRDLKLAVKKGEFRADLYYRINNFPIRLPALCERKDDIPLLAEHFVHKHARRLGKDVDAISSAMLKELVEYAWPGNVRELESVIERALISSTSDSVLKLPGPLKPAVAVGENTDSLSMTGRSDLATIERSHILNVLEETAWQIAGTAGAATVLGMPPSTLRSKMKRLGIARQSA